MEVDYSGDQKKDIYFEIVIFELIAIHVNLQLTIYLSWW